MARNSWASGLVIATLFLLASYSPVTTAIHTDPGDPDPEWLGPVSLSPLEVARASRPHLVVDSDGIATVIWEQRWTGLGGQPVVTTNRYGQGGWDAAADLPFSFDASTPDLAVNPRGNVVRDAETGQEYDTIGVWRQGQHVTASLGLAGANWSPPQALAEVVGSEDLHLQVAMDAAGNALVVWSGSRPLPEGGRHAPSVYADRYTPTTGWQGPVHLDGPGEPQGATDPHLAMNGNGTAWVIWLSTRLFTPGIWANRFQHSGGWGQKVQITTNPSWEPPQVSVGRDGGAIAVWFEPIPWSGRPGTIYARHMVPGSAWGPPQAVASTKEDSSDLRIVRDQNGNALLVWKDEGWDTALHEYTRALHSSYFTPSSGWGTPFVLDSWAYNPQVVMDSQGNATMVWDGRGIRARPFYPSAGWGPVEVLGSGSEPHVAIEANGTTAVVWIDDGEPTAIRYVPGTGWGIPASVRARVPETTSHPQVAIGLRGDALAVWQQGTSILARWFIPGSGWAALQAIGAGAEPQAALNGQGDALVVWEREGGILARRWTLPTGWLPTEAVGEGELNGPLVMNGRGDAVVVWNRWSGDYWDVFARHFAPAVGWGPVATLEEEQYLWPVADAAIDDRGHALVAWRRHNDTFVDCIYAVRFNDRTGWSPAEEVVGGVFGGQDGVSVPHLAMNADGSAVLLWGQKPRELPSAERALMARSHGTDYWLHARPFNPGVGWGPVERISPLHDSADAYYAQIAVSEDGRALAVWRGCDSVSFSASWFTPGTGWNPVECVRTGWYMFHGFQVKIDAWGNALVTSSSGSFIVASYFTRDRGWGGTRVIAAEDGRVSTAMDGMGNALLAWTDWNGTASRIYAERYLRSPRPDLVLTSPLTRLVNRTSVTVAGQTNPGVSLTVNSNPVSVDARGTFRMTATLPEGDHALEVVATGAEGSTTTTALITVDTTPPLLSVTPPGDGGAVGTSLVTVTGTTEPSAQVVVDGFTVHVASDGSFAFKVALAEGENTIRVSATDQAGNTAATSVTVDYSAGSAPIVPIALVASSAAFLIASLLLYRVFRLRGTVRDRGLATPARSRFGFPWGRNRKVAAGAKWGTPVSDSINRGPWPTTEPGVDPLHLTAKERAVLHLLEYSKYTDAIEVPRSLTQGGIAEAAGFDRRHFAQYVRPLLQDGLIEERNAHVVGALQRRKVYVLTYAGWHKALGLRDRIQGTVVQVTDASGVREAPIETVLAQTQGSRSFLDVVREVIETGGLDLTSGE